MPPKSQVWRYFEETKADDGCKAAICRLCKENPPLLRCTDNSTSPLWSHLVKFHKEDHDRIQKKKESLHCVKRAAGGTVFRQRTMAEVLSNQAPYGRDHPKQKKFDSNFKNQIINDFIPFKMADSKSYRKTVFDLDPRIKVKSGRTYSRQIRKKEKFVKKKIRNIVKKNTTNFLALTTDMWDDSKQNSYCALTTHFITSEDFKLVRVTPAIRYFGTARHQSENIAKVLSEEIASVKVDNDVPVVIVSDGTANMVKTRQILKENGVVDLEMDCTIHKLQNAVKDTNKETKGIAKAVLKSKKLIKFFRKSPLASNRLKKACEKAGHKHKKILKWVDIRWNTMHDGLKRLLYHQECIEEMDRNRHLDKVAQHIPNREEWRQLEAAVEILEPVKTATKVLESETKPTLNRLAECLYDIKEGLKTKSEDVDTPRYAKAYAKNLRKNIETRFPHNCLDESVVSYANFLDPHLKGIHVELEKFMVETKEKVKSTIAEYSIEVEDEAMIVEDNENNKSIEKTVQLTATQKLLQKKRNPLSDVFDEGGSREKEAAHEIDVYMKLPPCNRDDDVLKWWQDHSKILPRLSIFARQILAIPASTSASERLFSIGGLFDSLKRSRLDPETLELLTLLKTNNTVFEFENDDTDSEEETTCDENDVENDSDKSFEEESDGSRSCERGGDLESSEEDGDTD